MEMPCRKWGGRTSIALALGLTVSLSRPASAQSVDHRHRSESDTPIGRTVTDSAAGRPSDLLIKTHDASGKIGVALPLDIKLVRVRNVYIEAIKLLGLPRGVTISDATNTFSSTSDNNDVDVSTWDLSRIQILQNDARESSFALSVAAIWTPESGGHIDVTSSRLNVTFTPDRLDRDVAAGGGEPGNVTPPAAQIRETRPPSRTLAASASPDVMASDVPVQAVPVAPPESVAASDQPAPPATADKKRGAGAQATSLPRPAMPTRTPAAADPLVERAKGLIRLGDISGARLLLERAQARDAPDATFLLAQTWDPAMLRAWKVHGLRSDQDLAQSLYAKAARQDRTEERRLAATGR
ncbi:hypothetical protein [Methylobacterium pseudosasicola]|uniref:Uncharacterized protein n=1 Tax=Methylobacterium pseudosasicola TaxID=582667 RepID=A0A1I4RVR8_9HYPH|nr:hypothetical protein [Methylobacterium pseudosasicola]SFM56103.1 hypothetical protein SAMN05192568_10388 [Methylobacterium pseudosasicola]